MKTQKSSIKSKIKKRSSLLEAEKFGRFYLIFAILILLGSTMYWVALGTAYQMNNADQLVNSMLFSGFQDITNAMLPSTHTFLLKWPLFLIAGLSGPKTWVLFAITILTVVATISCFAYILYRIEKRPSVIGTIYLIMASMLILVPTASYGGALLPVNMAMLATRNLEYILYIVALFFVFKGRMIWIGKPKNNFKYVIFGIILLTLLFASDKLFVSLSIGGALGVIVVYSVAKQAEIVKIGLSWLFSSIVAFLSAGLLLGFLSAANFTNIVSTGSGLAPYQMTSSAKEFALALIFGANGLLTNFGANPLYDVLILKDWNVSFKEHFLSFGGLGYLLNFILLAIGFCLVFKLIAASVKAKTPKSHALPFGPVLAIMLISSSVVSIIVFVASSHYYPVDARYLAITFFAIFVAITSSIKNRFSNRNLLTVGLMCTVAVVLSMVSAGHTNQKDISKLSIIFENNTKIQKILEQNEVSYLIGDYWRVVPVAFNSGEKITPVPLSNCTDPYPVLNSSKWQTKKNSNFAYLLSFQKGLTGFPECNIKQITDKYGQPISIVIVDGSQQNPKEILLLYRNNFSSIEKITEDAVDLDSIAHGCKKTDMNIVAHEDDDLLFMNPDILNSIRNGNCQRTIFLTAGDSGAGPTYWLGREKGAEAAYSYMANISLTSWRHKTAKLSDNAYAQVSSPSSKISLIYLRLPDGGVTGFGFDSSLYTNISKLRSASIGSITSVDLNSNYKDDQINQALLNLMEFYRPSVVRTLSSSSNYDHPEHSDHTTTGLYADDVFNNYLTASQNNIFTAEILDPNSFFVPFECQDRSKTICNSIGPSKIGKPVVEKPQIIHYLGYKGRSYPENVFGTEFEDKLKTFLAYAGNDGAVCSNAEQCLQNETYAAYLRRQHKE